VDANDPPAGGLGGPAAPVNLPFRYPSVEAGGGATGGAGLGLGIEMLGIPILGALGRKEGKVGAGVKLIGAGANGGAIVGFGATTAGLVGLAVGGVAMGPDESSAFRPARRFSARLM